MHLKKVGKYFFKWVSIMAAASLNIEILGLEN